MRAEIVSVGTELLLGEIVDTNAARLSRALADLGISVYRRTTVGDNHDRLLSAFRSGLADNEILLAIGGLGPTGDDITRNVLAEALDDDLRYDEGIARRLKAFFRARKIEMPETVLRQAMVPTSGRPLDNPNGTAPGLLFEKNGKIGIALPGPPSEFNPMVDNHVVPYLRERTGGRGAIRKRIIRICNMGESMVEQKLLDLMSDSNPTVAPYAKTGEVHVRVAARADDPAEADRIVAERAEEICRRLQEHVYAFDEEPIEGAVIRLFREREWTLATAESCTGGLVSMRLTDVPGSSEVFLGGAVTYSNEAKADLVKVPSELIARVGAVSGEVAEAMAAGARERFGADFGVGITGIAGPGGGTEEKPVGLVYIAVSGPEGTRVERTIFAGERSHVRQRSAQLALVMLRDAALGQGPQKQSA